MQTLEELLVQANEVMQKHAPAAFAGWCGAVKRADLSAAYEETVTAVHKMLHGLGAMITPRELNNAAHDTVLRTFMYKVVTGKRISRERRYRQKKRQQKQQTDEDLNTASFHDTD